MYLIFNNARPVPPAPATPARTLPAAAPDPNVWVRTGSTRTGATYSARRYWCATLAAPERPGIFIVRIELGAAHPSIPGLYRPLLADPRYDPLPLPEYVDARCLSIVAPADYAPPAPTAAQYARRGLR